MTSLPSTDGDDTNKLEFFEAMRDFRKMFPTIEDDVIEAVLRSNCGAVDDTIDQLLVMSLEKEEGNAYAETLPKRIGDLETASPRVDITPVQPVASVGMDCCAASSVPRPLFDLNDGAASAMSSTLINRQISPATTSGPRSPAVRKKIYRPPLVGALPPDFLRISSSADPWEHSTNSGASPRQPYSTRRATGDFYDRCHDRGEVQYPEGPPPPYSVAVGRRHSEKATTKLEPRPYNSLRHTYLGVFRTTTMQPRAPRTSPRRITRDLAPSAEVLREAWEENEWKRQEGADPELAQYLEDERIAIMLQNEEFMAHLRNDREFLAALERDATEARRKESPRKTSTSRQRTQRDPDHISLFDNPGPSASAGAYGGDPVSADPFPYTKSLPKDEAMDSSFQEKLTLMGRTSRRKFATLARRFIKKKRGAKGVLDNNESRTHALLLDSDEDSDGSQTIDRNSGYNQHGDDDYNIGRRSDLKEGRFF